MIPLRWLISALAVFCTVFAVLVYQFSKPVDALPVLGTLPPFSLSNQAEEIIDLDAMAGKIWVADFIFTSCAGPCPEMTKQMKRLADRVQGGDRVQFVSISVDPETDTPERLRAYGEQYQADFRRWHFLTGDRDTIEMLAVEGFKVGSVENPVIHSTRFVLIDGEGRIRGYFHGLEEETIPALQAAIGLLLKEFSA